MLINCQPESLFDELDTYYSIYYTVRAYVCESCNKDWSEIVKRNIDISTECPKCNTQTLESIIFDTPICFVQQDAVTLGQLAERNTKKMSKDEYNEKLDKHTRQGQKGREKLGVASPFGEAPKDLHTYTPKQQQEYIVDGKKK